VLAIQWWRLRNGTATASSYSNPLITGYAACYLVVMAGLWISALPAYFAAVDGGTANGDPTGSLGYTIVCFLLAGLGVAAAGTAHRSTARPEAAGVEVGYRASGR
jgi:hypothetical protein